MGIDNDDTDPIPARRKVVSRQSLTRLELITLAGLDFYGNEQEAVLEVTTVDDHVYRLKVERIW